MSSKFSLSSTRVQRKPHVCKSKPTPKAQPPAIRSFTATIGGSITTPPGPPAKVFSQTAPMTGSGSTWQASGVDSAGNAWTATFNIPDAPGSITGSLLWQIPGATTTGTYLDATWNNTVSEIAVCTWTPTTSPGASGGCSIQRNT